MTRYRLTLLLVFARALGFGAGYLAFGPGAPPGTEPEVQRTIVRMRHLLDSTRER